MARTPAKSYIGKTSFSFAETTSIEKGDFEGETGNAGLWKRNDNNATETRQEVVRIYLLQEELPSTIVIY